MKRHRDTAFRWLVLLALVLVQACASGRKPVAIAEPVVQIAKTLTADYLLPADAFKLVGNAPALAPAKKVLSVVGRAADMKPLVLLYASPTTRRYLEAGGADFKANIRVWETFLRKYRIPYQTLTSLEQLLASTPGALVLPSLVALSQNEKVAVQKFRAQGGSVLSTWATGVRDENGVWQGFGYMKTALDVVVAGDTAHEEGVNFMMPFGEGPITHSLPAGQRIWLERIAGFYPLRLVGQQPAAQIMDWSRKTVMGKPGTTIVLGEAAQASGLLSRTVTLGYPERLWLSADPKSLEAIAYNAISWLLRQPDAYLAAWPFPYTAAMSLMLDAPEVVDEVDLKFVQSVEQAGGRATFYVLTEKAQASREMLKKLQTQGHEIAYLGDRFEGFLDQPAAKQLERLKRMQEEMRLAGVVPNPMPGFHAPMDSQDKTTGQLLNQLGFGHSVVFMDATDGILPFLQPRAADAAQAGGAFVVIPSVISGPEDLIAEGDPEEGMLQFMAEFDLAEAMGGLALVRLPNQTLLDESQQGRIFGRFKNRAESLWFATNSQVADWYQSRSGISMDLLPTPAGPSLTVRVAAAGAARSAVSALVNLPYPGDNLTLVPDGQATHNVQVKSIDAWRVALGFGQLAPGTYRWTLRLNRR